MKDFDLDSIPDIDLLMSDREIFNSFVYTPINQAIIELENRKNDSNIDIELKKYGNFVKPKIFSKDSIYAVLFRQLATPNYEFRRFVNLLDPLSEIVKPVVFEYYSDKFVSNNEYKTSLGKINFFCGVGKKGGSKIKSTTVIDFNENGGLKIKDVKTLWGQNLIDFHRELFKKTFEHNEDIIFFEASDWFKESGKSAKDYYMNFISLFLKNGILFENFMFNEEEFMFTKDIFLPSFIELIKITGKKPIIVALEPTDIEGDKFWFCHPESSFSIIEDKIK